MWRPPREARVLRGHEVLEGERILPAFRLEVAGIFRR